MTSESTQAFLVRLSDAIAEFERRIPERQISPAVLVTAHSFARAVRLFRATMATDAEVFGPEVAVLCRPLVEEVFRLQQLGDGDGETRERLALGHLAEEAEHARRIGKHAEQARIDVPPEAWEEHAARCEERIVSYEAERRIARRSFQTPAQYASNSRGLVARRNLFELVVLNFFAHGSAVTRGFVGEEKDGVAHVGAPTDPGFFRIVPLQAADYVMQAVAAVADIFGVASSEFERLSEELDLELRRLSDER